MEGIDVTAIMGGGGPWIILAIAVLGLVRGDLVPRSTHERAINHRDSIIRDLTTDRDYYRDQTLQLLGVAEVVANQAFHMRHGFPRPDLARDRDDS